MNLYGATAIVDDRPTGAFLLAKNPDDAAAKAVKRLPNGGKLTHIVFFCEARLGTLRRNRLAELVPKSDQVEFVAETLLEMIGAMVTANNTLRSTISAIHDVVTNRLGFKQFVFTVTESNGVLQQHSCFHLNLQKATEQAEQFAREQYGNDAELTHIEEVQG